MDHKPPSSLITQVSKEDAQRLVDIKLTKTDDTTDHQHIQIDTNSNNNSTQSSNQANSNTSNSKEEKSSFSLLKLLCCCFFHPVERSNAAYRKDVLDLQETYLLPPLTPDMIGKKTLVLDLDETLVHSSFKPIPNPDFIIPVEIEDQIHKVYVVKRPHVDQFMQRVGKLYEVVVFTASLAKYADPVLDLLDVHRVVSARLFREACSNYKGNYVKDLSRLGRELNHSLIIDNSPPSYLFHPENAVPIESWFDDENDTELIDLLPLLEHLTKVDNVRTYLQNLKNKGGKLSSHKFS